MPLKRTTMQYLPPKPHTGEVFCLLRHLRPQSWEYVIANTIQGRERERAEAEAARRAEEEAARQAEDDDEDDHNEDEDENEREDAMDRETELIDDVFEDDIDNDPGELDNLLAALKRLEEGEEDLTD